MCKPHYYQKVINSQATLIFVLGVPIFALRWRLFIRCCCAKRDDFISERRRKPL